MGRKDNHMSQFYLIAGTKGGIGKTFAATLLADSAFDLGRRIVLFDCDDENSTLADSYQREIPGVTVVKVGLDSDPEKEYPLDRIVNTIAGMETGRERSDTVYLADMKAGTSHRTIDWMRCFPFDLFREYGIRIVLVGIVTGDIDSVLTLAVWIKQYLEEFKDGSMRLQIIKNHFLNVPFDFYEQKLAPSIRSLPGCSVIELDSLGVRTLKAVRDMNTSLGQMVSGKTPIPSFEIMDNIRCGSYYHRMKKRFQSMLEQDASRPEDARSKESKRHAG